MLVPKILYNPGSGAVTLNFTFPPVQKPGADLLVAERHDTTSSFGIQQRIVERVEVHRELHMTNVPRADLAAWQAFMLHALGGGVFTYYPDATDSSTHDDWSLEDTNWTPAFASRQMSGFTLKMRKEIV